MTANFSRGPQDTVVARFNAAEAALLRTLLNDLLGLLDIGEPNDTGLDPLERELGLSGNSELPEDAALARLLPDAYRDDPEASSEFRRYTEADLREGKRSHARTVLATLDRVEHARRDSVPLDGAESQAWLGALNDLRLALAARLNVTDPEEDLAARYTADDPRGMLVTGYQWLGLLQETLVDSLD